MFRKKISSVVIPIIIGMCISVIPYQENMAGETSNKSVSVQSSGEPSGDAQVISEETEDIDEIELYAVGEKDISQTEFIKSLLSKVGKGYSQSKRYEENYYDCSSLAYYSWKDAGVDISHGGATTAAAEAQGLDEAGKTVSYDQMQPGDLIFYSFTSNGRYKNISHVAVYVWDGKVVEALNENSGVVYRDVASVGKIVVIGRP